MLTQCSRKTKFRKKCEFSSFLVRKYKLILITLVGTGAVDSDLTLTYFSINNFNWLRSILVSL